MLHAAGTADTLRGRVVGVTDGDTLTVLAAGQPHKVRLAGIDAPERRQAFGHAAKQALAAAAFDKPVVVVFHKRANGRPDSALYGHVAVEALERPAVRQGS